MLLSFPITIKAQEEVRSIIERVSNAQYIFEGKVIFSKGYKKADESNIYTTNTIEITKVFKGNLQCGKVEVISSGGTVDDSKVLHSHLVSLKEGCTGVFMCGVNEKELPQIDYITEENLTKLYPIFENQSLIKYYYEGLRLIASDYTFNIDSLARAYDLIQLVSQINYIDCNNSATIIGGNLAAPPPEPYRPDTMPNYRRADYDSIMAYMNIRSSSAQAKTTAAISTLNYSFSNAIITGSSPKYIEFDVNISHNLPRLYFNLGVIRLNYNTATFGSNVVANRKIQVTRGTVIANSGSYSAPTPADISNNEVAIPLSSVFPSTALTNLFNLSSSPTQAVHVKIEIANCNGSNISFTSQYEMGSISFYSSDVSGATFVRYDTIMATGSLTVPACVPTITSFSPTTITGGYGELLTIKGFQFGTNPKVYFPNANDAGMSMVQMNTTDFPTDAYPNSDTMITLRVPSLNDTVIRNGVIEGMIATPGSGIFKVVNSAGLTAVRSEPLRIFSSVANNINVDGNKLIINLVKRDSNGGYQFYVDTALWNRPERKACVLKAVRDWTCLTGVKWEVTDTTVVQNDAGALDNKNVIQLGIPSTQSSLGTVLANTDQNVRQCGNRVIAVELDLVMNRNTDWWYDTTATRAVPDGKRDFYATILHELGHAHSLYHIIDPTAIMDFAAQPVGPLAANRRKIHLDRDLSCGDGGDKVMFRSSRITTSACPTIASPIIRQYVCGPITPTSEVQKEAIEVNAYPNPFMDKIMIEYTFMSDAKMDIYLMDMQGRTFAKDDLKIVNAGVYKSEIQITNAPAGQYILWGHINGKVFHKNLTVIAK